MTQLNTIGTAIATAIGAASVRERILPTLRSFGLLALLLSWTLTSFAFREHAIQITEAPPAVPGGPDQLGRISGVVDTDCDDCVVVLFAFGDVWYVQPWTAAPYTSFDADGKWSADTHLGTEYAAALVRKSYKPPERTSSLPRVQGEVLAVARAKGGQRSPAPQRASTAPEPGKVLRFAGRDWDVKSGGPIGPGPNYFSSHNAWTDSSGKLHLKISNEGGRWNCSEVICRLKGLGYGLYRFKIGDTSAFPPNVVLGLFTWDTRASDQHHREIDVEVSRWNDPNNANGQFVVQPPLPANIDRFEIPGGKTEHQFVWNEDILSFQSMHLLDGENRKIRDHTFREGVPVPGDEQVRLNLWLAGGKPPKDGGEVEVTIDSFEFQPRVSDQ